MFEAFPTAGVKPANGAEDQEAGNSWPRDGEVVPAPGDTFLGGDPKGWKFSLGVLLGVGSKVVGASRTPTLCVCGHPGGLPLHLPSTAALLKSDV